MPEPEIIVTDPAESTPDPTLAIIRELVLKAHPDVVPELVTGASIADLLASIGPAGEAYARLADHLQPAPPSVPAGASVPATLDPDRMPAALKIQLGLRNRPTR